MADLAESAEKFFQALIAQDMGVLMGSFTPAGMSKAMSLGQQGPPGKPSRTEVQIGDAEGDDHPVKLVAETEQGQAVIGTVWREESGGWKVNDIEIVKMP